MGQTKKNTNKQIKNYTEKMRTKIKMANLRRKQVTDIKKNSTTRERTENKLKKEESCKKWN